MTGLSRPPVAIIGAGPYGLSVAAHLRSKGVGFRIFGTPMNTWRSHMPQGMFLKSEGCASNLSDPAGDFTLGRFCADEGRAYAEHGVPVPLETFTQYALAFQRRFVPDVEDVAVAALDGRPGQFALDLANGETVRAGRVVVATGVAHAAHVPAELAALPAELASHSGCHYDLGRFRARHVTVLGAGQSALETAALLQDCGADVLLIARRPAVRWNEPPAPDGRPLYERVRRPTSPLGTGLGPWFYSHAPMIFRRLPRSVRITRVAKSLGPSGAWWLRDRALGRLPILTGHSLKGARESCGRAVLDLRTSDGGSRQVTTDHVIAATGYRFALGSLPFLGDRLRQQLRATNQSPVLSADFESSVTGLYFTGLASAIQFGPSMRFLYGAGYTAHRLSRHLAGGRRRLTWSLFAGPQPTADTV